MSTGRGPGPDTKTDTLARPAPPASARERLLDLGYRRVLRPALFASCGGDPERVHEATLAALARLGESAVARRGMAALTSGPRRGVRLAGIDFPGVVGLAAGLDKNATAVRAWSSLGFGHAELGTVTASAQPGNPTPRLFRLPDSRALVNRMGFNNAGAGALAERLRRLGVRRGNAAVGMPLGISIGKTATTPLATATQDYLTAFRLLAPYADYVAVNVSSPNTVGLRGLQQRAALQELTVELVTQARQLDPDTPVPLFVKIAPDLSWSAIDEVLGVCVDAGVAGVIATNTTLGRDRLSPGDVARGAETGGLSGAPLAQRARQVVGYLTAASDLPVIGVGGILTADDASAMLDAGARLLQIYTGYIYAGPALVAQIDRAYLARSDG